MTYKDYINNKIKQAREFNKEQEKLKLEKRWGELCGLASDYYSLKTTAEHYGLKVVPK